MVLCHPRLTTYRRTAHSSLCDTLSHEMSVVQMELYHPGLTAHDFLHDTLSHRHEQPVVQVELYHPGLTSYRMTTYAPVYN